MLSLLVTILVIGLLVGLAFYFIDLLPFIISPFKEVAKAIIILVVIVYVFSLLPGHPFIR